MKAFVTGAGGFIGSHLCRRLIEEGAIVRGLFLPGEPTGGMGEAGVEVVRGDLLAPETLQGLAGEADAVFHLAARVADWGPWEAFSSVIVDGTRNLLEACAGTCGRFVFLSSIAAYGMDRHLAGCIEDTPCRPAGLPYGDCKCEAEGVVRAHGEKTGLAYTIIRPANVTGPGSVWVRDVLDAFFRGPLPLVDGGRYSASLLGVDNLVDGIWLAGTRPEAAGECFNFRDDWQVTWKRYLTDLGAMAGKRPLGSVPFPIAWRLAALFERVFDPLGLRPPITRMGAGITGRNNDVSAEKARRVLGWTTRVSYEEMLEKIEVWVKSTYLPGRKKK